MTDSSSSGPASYRKNDDVDVTEAMRKIVESNRDVSERVRNVVVGLFQGQAGATQAARDAVMGAIQTASEIANRSAPDKADSVLRNVIDGVTTGLSTVAQSTQYAVQEATARGQRFASEDMDRARKDLSGISEILVDTAKYFSKRMTEEAGSTVTELKTHAERAVAAATPVVKASVEALAKHPIQTVGEAASTALRSGQLTAGALLSAVSGALAGAADLLDPDRRRKSKPTMTAAQAAAAAALAEDPRDSAL